MSSTAKNIMTVNAGSSSVKLAVLTQGGHASEMTRLLAVSVSGIGQPVSALEIIRLDEPVQVQEIHVSDYTAASRIALQAVAQAVEPDSIVAVGHRLVHGGAKYSGAVMAKVISDDDWNLLARLDPHHTPAARQLIGQCARQYPSIPQVVCFDTAFFRDLPRVAQMIPIPRKYYARGVRRYGFHGLSYMSVLSSFREKAGAEAVRGRVIVAHLGGGASLAAMKSGKPVDTTMALTPASGIVMGTRSGDLDPGIFNLLHRQDAMGADEFDHMVNYESGLRGVSGITGDMYTLLQLEKDNADAALAIELFVRDVKKTIGAFCAVLGGVDSLIFSGGIGEQSALLRSRICQGLAYMGIEIDEAANKEHAFLISAEHGAAGVHVIPTDEASVIAVQIIELLRTQSKGHEHGTRDDATR